MGRRTGFGGWVVGWGGDGTGGKEVCILCRSRERAEKEKGIHDRFEQRIEEVLNQMAKSCEKRRYRVGVMERRIGKLLGRNSRAGGVFWGRGGKGLEGGAEGGWGERGEWG